MNVINLIYETDAEIISAYKETGSNIAANAFVRKYQSFVFATAMRYVQNRMDADDISQEVFIKALSGLKTFRNESSIKTWLYIITSNYCKNHLRKKRWLSFFSPGSEEVEFILPDSNVLQDQKLQNEEFNKKFLLELSKLPEKQRETFALRYFDEFSYEEISNILGTSVGGLKANYFHAIQKLSKVLKKELI